MGEEWDIEIEPEVRQWLDNLSDRDYLQAEHAAERLLDAPTTLGEPYSRHWVTAYANCDSGWDTTATPSG
jgi:hypothetical protein